MGMVQCTVLADSSTPTATFTKGTGLRTERMAMAPTHTKMGLTMWALGIMTYRMARAWRFGRMEAGMRVILPAALNMAGAASTGKMALCLWDNSIVTLSTGMGSTSGSAVALSRVSGSRIACMDEVRFHGQMASAIVASTLMISNMALACSRLPTAGFLLVVGAM